MKNKLLSLGVLAIVGGSSFVVVACGDKDNKDKNAKKLLAELAKLQNFDSVDSATGQNTTFSGKAVGVDVKTEFLALTEVKATTYNEFTPYNNALASGVKVKTVVVKTAYNTSTKVVVLTVTLEYNGATDKKDVTIKFETTNLSVEANKLQDVTIVKSADKAVSGYNFGNKAKDDDVKAKVGNLDGLQSSSVWANGVDKLLQSELDAGVTIDSIVVKTPYDVKTGKLVVKVTLAKSGEIVQAGSNVKDVVITFGGEDLTAEVAKLKAEIADVANNKITDVENLLADANAKSFYQGLTSAQKLVDSDTSLASGVTTDTVTVKTVYNSTTRTVVLTVKLTKTSINGIKYGTNTKDVTITFSAS